MSVICVSPTRSYRDTPGGPEKHKCGAKGCYSQAVFCASSSDHFFLCSSHEARVPDEVLRRLQHRLVRARTIREIWENEEYFDRAVQAGKYLSLCSLFVRAADAVDQAWIEVIRSARPRRAKRLSRGVDQSRIAA